MLIGLHNLQIISSLRTYFKGAHREDQFLIIKMPVDFERDNLKNTDDILSSGEIEYTWNT